MSERVPTEIDDRWIDLAAEQRRIIKGADEQTKQLTAQMQNHTKRRDAAAAELQRIKQAIESKAPFVFVEPEPKK